MKYYIDTEFLEGTQSKNLLGFIYGKTKPTIDLISIGIVAEDGREYYAVSKDFNLKEAWNKFDLKTREHTRLVSAEGEQLGNTIQYQERNKDVVDWENKNPGFTTTYKKGDKYKEYWIRENVLKPIWKELGFEVKVSPKEFTEFTYSTMKTLLSKYGKTNNQIAEEIKKFTHLPQGYELENIANEKKKHTPNLLGFKKEHLNWTPIEFYAYYADYDWVAFCWLFGKMIDLPKGFPKYCIDLKQELDNKQLSYDKSKMGIKVKDIETYPKQTNEHNALADAKWNKQLHEFLNKI
jgi:hypothetical protein